MDVGGIFTSASHTKALLIFRHLKRHLYLEDSNYKKKKIQIFNLVENKQLVPNDRALGTTAGTAGRCLMDSGAGGGIDKLSFRVKPDELHC